MTPAELRSWRRAHGYTQAQLAAALGIHVHVYTRWEATTVTHRQPPPYLWRALRDLAEHDMELQGK